MSVVFPNYFELNSNQRHASEIDGDEK